MTRLNDGCRGILTQLSFHCQAIAGYRQRIRQNGAAGFQLLRLLTDIQLHWDAAVKLAQQVGDAASVLLPTAGIPTEPELVSRIEQAEREIDRLEQRVASGVYPQHIPELSVVLERWRQRRAADLQTIADHCPESRCALRATLAQSTNGKTAPVLEESG